MSYASITVAEGLTMADYDAVDEHLGPGRADGLLIEAAGCGEGGLYVITLWESKAEHERFIAQRLVPAFRAANLQPGPMSFTGVDVEALYQRAAEPATP
jgi:hypothetical protein